MGLLDGFKPAQKRYEKQNPVVVVHDTFAEAYQAARDEAQSSGGVVYSTSGTPSMEPLITGKVFTVNVPQKYDDLQEGQVVNYKPDLSGDLAARYPALKAGAIVTHRLVEKDGAGWIGSGDNNAHSEAWARIRPENLVNVVRTIHTYKGAEKTRVK